MKTLLFVVLLVSVLVLPVFAGWTVTNLRPVGASGSDGSGIFANQQVGSANIDNSDHASLWNGSVTSWVDLNPDGYIQSYALDTSGSQQVGRAYVDDHTFSHAGLWSGSAESWVDLHPAGASTSEANAIDNDKQAGGSKTGIFWHAGYWSGSAASWTDLNPTGYISSMATGISGNQQVGTANYVDGNYNEYSHAGIWSGTAESWTDINPTGAKYSYAYGTSGDQQVGTAYFGSDTNAPMWSYHASLWSGTKSSWIDLNPAGSDFSQANGVAGGIQVGDARVITPNGIVDANIHASLWRGTAASWEDLHALLPAGEYSASHALDVDVSGTTTSIVGYAYNTHGGYDSILWQYTPVPEPSSLIALGVLLTPFLFRRRFQSCHRL